MDIFGDALGFLILAALFAVTGVPAAKILHRVGLSKWWTVIAVIPVVGIVGLWVFAFAKWPADTAAR